MKSRLIQIRVCPVGIRGIREQTTNILPRPPFNRGLSPNPVVDVRAQDRDEVQPRDYGIDALTVLAGGDFKPVEDPVEYMAEHVDDFRYMLLKANVEAGEGELLVEPCLQHYRELMAADLLKDWSAATEQLYQCAAETWINSLDEESEELAPKTSAKVIHLAPHIQKKRTTSKPERDEEGYCLAAGYGEFLPERKRMMQRGLITWMAWPLAPLWSACLARWREPHTW